jgi:NTE family protein
LARLFTGPRAAKGVVWFSLPGGRPLYRAGQPADTLYFVRSGRLGVTRDVPGQPQQLVGVIKPGEPAGEMALIAGTPHSATVTALRDSEILAMSRQAFYAEARKQPDVMAELARLMILRTRQAAGHAATNEPAVFGFCGVSPGAQVRSLCEAVAQCIGDLGFSVKVVGAESANQPPEWFSRIELSHDVMILAAEASEPDWSHLCARQVDRLFLVGKGDARPPQDGAPLATVATQLRRITDLVLIQPEDCHMPQGSEDWRHAVGATRIFQVKRGLKDDLARLARILTGTSVGLALSGGGARAYAHLGVIRAFREAGAPIDLVSGASMGAVVAAGVAMGWQDKEICERISDAFVISNPLGDIAFPMVAMTQGLTVKQRLKKHFGNVEIADLWLPFFCTSSNLTTAACHLHQRGRVRSALRASVALPGILPPVVMGGDVLVDGAVMCNLPTDIMRNWHRGPVVGVDVAAAEGLTAQDVARPPSISRWLLSGEWRHGPPIVSILIRAATAPTARETAQAHEACDLLISPLIEGVELRDWRAFDPAVEAGYAAGRKALAELKTPLIHLRRAGHTAEPQLFDFAAGGQD